MKFNKKRSFHRLLCLLMVMPALLMGQKAWAEEAFTSSEEDRIIRKAVRIDFVGKEPASPAEPEEESDSGLTGEPDTQETDLPVASVEEFKPRIYKAQTIPVTVEEIEEDFTSGSAYSWNGPVLNTMSGTVMGPSGKETYYNLDMSGVVSIMRGMGNQDPYWVRDDGCKMLGDYIMCAAHLGIHPRGSLVPCSLGMAIVCDTGGFADWNPYQLDIAVTW